MTFAVFAAIVLLVWAGVAMTVITVVTCANFRDALERKLTRTIIAQSVLAQAIAALTLVVCAAGAAALLQT